MDSMPLNTKKTKNSLSGKPDLSCFFIYPSGFNGQERDDELAGVGNFNTALYWEYDTRLGRRWNVDPVKKIWQSSYTCFSNSPIWKEDPNGDDDFFNSKGKFLYADNKESRIIFIVDEKGIKTQIKDYTFTKDNAKTLADIGNYYAKSAGLDVGELGGGSISVAARGRVGLSSGQIEITSTNLYNKGSVGSGNDIMNHNDETNRISFSLDGNKVNPLLNDANNLISTLSHEKSHGDYYTNEGFEHLAVYYDEIKNPNFTNTTIEYKNNTYANIRKLLNAVEGYQDKSYSKAQNLAIQKEGARWKKKFNDAGGVYEKRK